MKNEKDKSIRKALPKYLSYNVLKNSTNSATLFWNIKMFLISIY